MGVLLGYPNPDPRGNRVVHSSLHRSVSPGDLHPEQVRTLCAGLHADAQMPDLSSALGRGSKSVS